MKALVLIDDELKRLEKRFGPGVRQMGPWSSDGTFGYATVSITAIKRAAEELDKPNLTIAVSGLKDQPEPTKAFIELLEIFGPAVVEKIVDAYRQCPLELIAEGLPARKTPQSGTNYVSVSRAS